MQKTINDVKFILSFPHIIDTAVIQLTYLTYFKLFCIYMFYDTLIVQVVVKKIISRYAFKILIRII